MSNLARRWKVPEMLEAVFDQLSDAVFLYDKSLHVVGVNQGAEHLGDRAQQIAHDLGFGNDPAQGRLGFLTDVFDDRNHAFQITGVIAELNRSNRYCPLPTVIQVEVESNVRQTGRLAYNQAIFEPSVQNL